MHAERDHLVLFVFPELKEKCRKHRINLIDVDLRWGVSEKDAQDGKALDICLDEIDSCRPFFLGLLGHRYGWVPLPGSIREKIIEKIDIDSKEFQLLKQAYRIDNRIDEFILKTDDELQTLWGDNNEKNRKALIQKLQLIGTPNTGLSITAREIYHGVLHNDIPDQIIDLKAIIHGKLEEKPLLTDEQIKCLQKCYRWDGHKGKYLFNVNSTEQELRIIRSIFQTFSIYQQKRSSFFFRSESLTKQLAGNNSSDFFEQEEENKRKLDNLKLEIVTKGLFTKEYDDLETFGNLVEDILWQQIENELDQPEEKEKDWSEEESEFHELFMADRTRHFVGREVLLKKLQGFSEQDKKKSILVITGEPGCGKSALMSRFTEKIIQKHPDWLIIPHFIGASPSSTSLRQSLYRFCSILNKSLALKTLIPENIKELKQLFPSLLQKAAENKKIFFIIDAVNQFEKTDDAHQMNWFPEELPVNVKAVFSAISSDALDALCSRQYKPDIKTITGLSEKDIAQFVKMYLQDIRRSFPNASIEQSFLAKVKNGNPLYMRVALEELRIFGKFEKLANRVEKLPHSISELFEQVIKRIEEDFSESLVRDFLSFIACGKRGMTAAELQILLRDHAPKQTSQSKPEKLPDMVWARLYRTVNAYLIERSGVIDFFHSQFKEAVIKKYLPPEIKSDVHIRLANFYDHQPTFDSPQQLHTANLRKLDELTFQQLNGKLWKEAIATLTDFKFIWAKLATNQIYLLTEDYNNGLKAFENENESEELKSLLAGFRTWSSFFRRNAYCFVGENWRSFLYLAYEQGSNIVGQAALEWVRKVPAETTWIRRVVELGRSERDNKLGTIPLNGRLESYSAISKNRIATSTADGFLKIWSSWDGRLLFQKEIALPEEKTDPAGAPFFEISEYSPDILIGIFGRTTTIWGSGQPFIAFYDMAIHEWDLHPFLSPTIHFPHSLTILPDGNLALLDRQQTRDIFIYDVNEKKITGILKGHTSKVNQLIIASNNSLLSCSEDGTIRAWNTKKYFLEKTIDIGTPVHAFGRTQNNYWIFQKEKPDFDDAGVRILDHSFENSRIPDGFWFRSVNRILDARVKSFITDGKNNVVIWTQKFIYLCSAEGKLRDSYEIDLEINTCRIVNDDLVVIKPLSHNKDQLFFWKLSNKQENEDRSPWDRQAVISPNGVLCQADIKSSGDSSVPEDQREWFVKKWKLKNNIFHYHKKSFKGIFDYSILDAGDLLLTFPKAISSTPSQLLVYGWDDGLLKIVIENISGNYAKNLTDTSIAIRPNNTVTLLGAHSDILRVDLKKQKISGHITIKNLEYAIIGDLDENSTIIYTQTRHVFRLDWSSNKAHLVTNYFSNIEDNREFSVRYIQKHCIPVSPNRILILCDSGYPAELERTLYLLELNSNNIEPICHDRSILDFDKSSRKLYLLDNNDNVEIWDADELKPITQELTNLPSTANLLQEDIFIDSNNNLFEIVKKNNLARCFIIDDPIGNPEDGIIKIIRSDVSSLRSVTFSLKEIAYSLANGIIKKHNLRNGTTIDLAKEEFYNSWYRIATSPDGIFLIVNGADGKLLMDTDSGSILHSIGAIGGEYKHEIIFSHNSQLVAIEEFSQNRIDVCELSSGKILKSIDEANFPAAFTVENSAILYTPARDSHKTSIFNFQNNESREVYQDKRDYFKSLYAIKNKYFFAAFRDYLFIINIASGQLIKKRELKCDIEGSMDELTVETNQKNLVAWVNKDSQLLLWDFEKEVLYGPHEIEGGPYFKFTCDNKYISTLTGVNFISYPVKNLLVPKIKIESPKQEPTVPQNSTSEETHGNHAQKVMRLNIPNRRDKIADHPETREVVNNSTSLTNKPQKQSKNMGKKIATKLRSLFKRQ